MTKDHAIISSVILSGDLSKLSATDKVQYFNGYCERLGLDPFTQPFQILRLNGKEILYLTRAGAQQLNKLHSVSHEIVSRNIHESASTYEVIARASLPDGRHTESIGAVTIANLKGEAYCNALMKAETKAKRRATLDLLGLGLLDETEVASIIPQEPVMASKMVTDDIEKALEYTYDNVPTLLATLDSCTTMIQMVKLYNCNRILIDRENLTAHFSAKKAMLNTTK
jgi:hypothetical protein